MEIKNFNVNVRTDLTGKDASYMFAAIQLPFHVVEIHAKTEVRAEVKIVAPRSVFTDVLQTRIRES